MTVCVLRVERNECMQHEHVAVDTGWMCDVWIPEIWQEVSMWRSGQRQSLRPTYI